MIDGGLGVGGDANDSAHRDRLTINDNSTASRKLDYIYLNAQGGVNVAPNPSYTTSGLFGGNLPGGELQVRGAETLIFNAPNGSKNDQDRVFGATDDGTIGGPNPANDVLTAALLNNDYSALVFRGGSPYLNSPPTGLAGSLPGVAGGGSGPDLLLNGISFSGLTLDGNGAAGRRRRPGRGLRGQRKRSGRFRQPDRHLRLWRRRAAARLRRRQRLR